MQISKIDNQPVFGINYVNKQMWHKSFIKSFEGLDLVKQIEKKYPNASASYRKTLETDINNKNPNFHLTFKIGLKDKLTWSANIDGDSSSKADRTLIDILSNTSLSDIEKQSVKKYKIKRVFSSDLREKNSDPITLEFRKLWFKIKQMF